MGSASDETAAAAAAAAAVAEGGPAGEAGPDSKDLQQQSKALDKLTDHVEDRQLDSSRVQSAMAALASSKEADWNAMRLSNQQPARTVWAQAGDVEGGGCLRTSARAWSCWPPEELLHDPRYLALARKNREKELAAVKINPTDVEIIANELELDKKIAERTLREHKGDAVAAVRSLLH
ncbi:uncharacterized protein [Lolium perenne]|uniref:uncharacterized protein isoform X1 n=1 Tax=Lolium perenne TaxID=4522 RepID=UPI0021F68B75|nr:uncharacterized protein LOC127291960 isoform X1 [Lolium perenne]